MVMIAALVLGVVAAALATPDPVFPKPPEDDAFDQLNPFDDLEDEYGMAFETDMEDQVLEDGDARTLLGEESLRSVDHARNRLGETLLQHRSDSPDNSTATQPTTIMLHRPFRPMDCAEHLVTGATTSGVYEIYPFTCLCSRPVKVWCDMVTDGGGWTVITTRLRDGSVNFNRTWEEYRVGFGNFSEEFWLGNEMIHSMTNSRAYHLRMDVRITDTDTRHGIWSSFYVRSEVHKYLLKLGKFSKQSTISNDCLKQAKGQGFSTNNRDYDKTKKSHCASVHGCGWWFGLCSPTEFNPSYPRHSCYTNANVIPTQIQLKMRPSVCSSTMKTVLLNNYDCNVCQ